MESMKITLNKSLVGGFIVALVVSYGIFVGLLHEKGLMIIGIGAIFGFIVGLINHIAWKVKHSQQEGNNQV